MLASETEQSVSGLKVTRPIALLQSQAGASRPGDRGSFGWRRTLTRRLMRSQMPRG
jgi:hypothetical protein